MALEGPLELRVVQISRMQIEVIGVDRDRRILELDDQLNPVTLGSRRKVEQRMVIEPQLFLHPLQPIVLRFRHPRIVKQLSRIDPSPPPC